MKKTRFTSLFFLFFVTTLFLTLFSTQRDVRAGEFKIKLFQLDLPDSQVTHPKKGLPVLHKNPIQKNSQHAIVLIHGFNTNHIHNSEKYDELLRDSWQNRDSKIVQRVASYGDVFSIVYTQNRFVDHIADFGRFHTLMRRLRDAGYKNITIIGSSAGGVIGRLFVENFPESKISRIIQVAAPNRGTPAANLGNIGGGIGLIDNEDFLEFLESLEPGTRKEISRSRQDKKIPDDVEFVSLIGTAIAGGDGVIGYQSAWPASIRDQGLPGVSAAAVHSYHMNNDHVIDWIEQIINKRIRQDLSSDEINDLSTILRQKQLLVLSNPDLTFGEESPELKKLNQLTQKIIFEKPAES